MRGGRPESAVPAQAPRHLAMSRETQAVPVRVAAAFVLVLIPPPPCVLSRSPQPLREWAWPSDVLAVLWRPAPAPQTALQPTWPPGHTPCMHPQGTRYPPGPAESWPRCGTTPRIVEVSGPAASARHIRTFTKARIVASTRHLVTPAPLASSSLTVTHSHPLSQHASFCQTT